MGVGAGRDDLLGFSESILEELSEVCERVEVGGFVLEQRQHDQRVRATEQGP
jgi:hypothetical protein